MPLTKSPVAAWQFLNNHRYNIVITLIRWNLLYVLTIVTCRFLTNHHCNIMKPAHTGFTAEKATFTNSLLKLFYSPISMKLSRNNRQNKRKDSTLPPVHNSNTFSFVTQITISTSLSIYAPLSDLCNLIYTLKNPLFKPKTKSISIDIAHALLHFIGYRIKI